MKLGFTRMITTVALAMVLFPATALASTSAARYVSNGGENYTHASQSASVQYEGNTYSSLFDGNYIGAKDTAAMLSTAQSGSQHDKDYLETWGFTQNVAPLINDPNGITSISNVIFHTEDYSYHQNGSLADANNYIAGADPAPGGSTDWAADLVGLGVAAFPDGTQWAEAGAIVSALANLISLPSSGYTTEAGGPPSGGSESANWAIEWNGINKEYDVPNGADGYSTVNSYDDDIDYRGYSQQFLMSATPGTEELNYGQVIYWTSWHYSSSPNIVYYSYDSSGVMSTGFTMP